MICGVPLCPVLCLVSDVLNNFFKDPLDLNTPFVIINIYQVWWHSLHKSATKVILLSKKILVPPTDPLGIRSLLQTTFVTYYYNSFV
jgi:hypothetical protein